MRRLEPRAILSACTPMSWGYTRGMPKVSIYLPDPLYDAVREHKIPVSVVAQQALEEAVRRRVNAEWIARVHARKPRTRVRIDTALVLDEVRSEFGT